MDEEAHVDAFEADDVDHIIRDIQDKLCLITQQDGGAGSVVVRLMTLAPCVVNYI